MNGKGTDEKRDSEVSDIKGKRVPWEGPMPIFFSYFINLFHSSLHVLLSVKTWVFLFSLFCISVSFRINSFGIHRRKRNRENQSYVMWCMGISGLNLVTY